MRSPEYLISLSFNEKLSHKGTDTYVLSCLFLLQPRHFYHACFMAILLAFIRFHPHATWYHILMLINFFFAYHVDCIGSAFNIKGAMQCPNCRKIEKGQWLYANGGRSYPEFNMDDWTYDEDLYDLSYSELVIVLLILYFIGILFYSCRRTQYKYTSFNGYLCLFI